MNFKMYIHNMAIGCRLTGFKWDGTPNSKLNHMVSILTLSYFCTYIYVRNPKTVATPVRIYTYTDFAIEMWGFYRRLKPATGRPYVRAFSLSGTVPAFTCDCLRFVCAFTPRPKVDLCVSTSSRTMLAFGNNVSFSSSACSTLASCRR